MNLTRSRLTTNYHRTHAALRSFRDQLRDIIVFLTNKKRQRKACRHFRLELQYRQVHISKGGWEFNIRIVLDACLQIIIIVHSIIVVVRMSWWWQIGERPKEFELDISDISLAAIVIRRGSIRL